VQSLGCSGGLSYKDYEVCDPEIARLPVINVTLIQANQFCTWLSGRLPTEMEWEWAARGAKNRLFPTGDKEPIPGEINIRDVKNPPLDLWPVDHVEKDFVPDYDSSNTLVGMAGNVREWTISWYIAYDQEGYRTTYWPMPLSGSGFVSVRGGSYRLTVTSARSSVRFSTESDQQLPDLGFRCLMKLSQEQLRKEVLSNP
jgi:formylglycine-generating enzyme